MKWSNCC